MEDILIGLEKKWMEGWKNKDLETCSKILADEFTLTSSLSSGDLMTKEQWLSALSRYNCTDFRFDKVKVRTYNDTAIVNSWFNQIADVSGKDWSGNFLITDVWIKKNGDWQVVARHASWLQNK